MRHEIAFRPDEWATRSEFWLEKSGASKPSRKLRERNPAPLILTGHGASLRVEHGALVIRDGFTHYPQEQARYRFFPRDLEMPTRIFLLDGSGTLSFEVLTWLSDQGVSLARINSSGEVATVISGSGFAADPEKIEWQRATRADPAKRLAFAADLIRRKVLSSIPTLEVFVPQSRHRDMALKKANAAIARLEGPTFNDVNEIFAIEGECASAYFGAWKGLPVKWKATGRHPVPEEWNAYNWRSSRATGVKPENRNASHPVNAMLNYGYAVKLAQLKIQAVCDGYDPRLGVMHNSHRGSLAWILDMIELDRSAVDAAILQIVRDNTFSAADFILRKDGVCRLSPQLSRMVVLAVS